MTSIISIISTFLVILISLVGFGSVVPVQEGSVHAVYKFGSIQQKILTPGLNLVTPFVTSTKEVDVSTKAVPETFSSLTKDGQKVTINATANYYVNASNVPQTGKIVIFTGDTTKDAEAIKNVILQPILLGEVKQIIAKYTIDEIISSQAQIGNEITDAINTAISSQSSIIVQQFVITGFVLDPEVQTAYEKKAIATQEQAQAIIRQKTAETLAATNDIISRSLTPVLLQKAAIDKWDGHTSVFGGGQSTPIILNANN